MLVHHESQSLLLKVRTLAKITALLPKYKPIDYDGHNLAVPHRLDEVKILRNIGIQAPSPILYYYKWPGPPHKPALEHQRLTAAFLTLHSRAFCFNEPGTAKTATALWAADYLMTQGVIRKVLVVAPNSSIDITWMEEIFQFLMHRRAALLVGSRERRAKLLATDSDFYIINHEGLATITDELKSRSDIDLVIGDECFVAGTPILTVRGSVDIEHIKTSDMILTPFGERRVLGLSRVSTTTTVKLHFATGDHFECTEDHPIFTDRGWVRAANCAGRFVFSDAALRNMQHDLHREENNVALRSKAWQWARAYLFAILQCEANASVATKQAVHEWFDAVQKRADSTNQGDNILSRTLRTDVEDCEDIWASPNNPQGQWHWYDPIRTTIADRTTSEFHLGILNSVGRQAAQLSYLLQSRLRLPCFENSNRSRRNIPSDPNWETAGCEEVGQTYGVRVDSVTHHQQGSPRDVFNIKVDECPWYYAAGKLVHNCDVWKNAGTDLYKNIEEVTRKRRIWLLSGTPVPNAPTDAWALTRLVNRDRVPVYFSQWRRQTMYQVSQYKWLPRMNSYELAYQAMQPAVRYRKKDCFDLPPMITTRRQAALTDEQKHAMTQLKYEAAAELKNGIQVTAVNAADKITKMRQILLGVIKVGEEQYIEVDHAPRVALLMQEIAKAVSKVIVIVPFKGIIRALESQIAKQHTVEIINGDVPRHERTNIIKRFKDTNDPHVLLCHPKVMSHSLNLAEAATLIFYGPIYSNGMHQQVIERIARPDQIHDMTIARIGCHPLEWQIYADVDAQRDMQASILAMFKHYVLEEK